MSAVPTMAFWVTWPQIRSPVVWAHGLCASIGTPGVRFLCAHGAMAVFGLDGVYHFGAESRLQSMLAIPMSYDAFISYSHQADHSLAVALELALQRLAKPWHRRRGLEIFRDGGNLNLSAHLWGSIEQALSGSRFLIYLASPAAARSPWIARELEYWIRHRDVDHLILVLTDGDLSWNAERAAFDGLDSTALPATLVNAFIGEPFYLDMRWTRDQENLSLANDRFKHQLVQIAATLKGVPVEDIEGQEAEQYRRMIYLRNAIITGLSVLAVAATGFAGFAYVQRQAAVRSEQFARVQQERAERAADSATTSARLAEERRILAETAGQKAAASEGVATAKAEEAARQRVIAEHEAHSARVALATTSVQEANRLIANHQRGEGLAHLARALRADPESMAAKGWISYFLLRDNWWWPAPLPHADVVKVALSPDGRWAVTSSRDGSARVWDTSTGHPIGAKLQHKSIVNSAVFSSDGRRIVTASADGTVRVWDTETGQPIGDPLTHQFQVRAAAFSGDGRRVLTITGNSARVWDAATGAPLGVPLEHPEPIWKSALTADGRYVGANSTSGLLRVWEAASGRPIELEQLADGGNWWAFDPDSRRIAANSDRSVRIWDLQTGRMVGDPLRHPDTVTEVRFSADGRRIFTDSFDGMLRIWESSSGKPLGDPQRHSPSGVFSSLMFTPEEHYAVTDSTTSQVWNAKTGEPVGPAVRVTGFQGMSMTPDGLRLVDVFGGIARVWRLWNRGAEPSVQSRPPVGGSVVAASMTPDGRRIVTAHTDGMTRVWDGNGEPAASPIRFWEPATSVAISPNGRRVVTGQINDFDDDTRILDLATGQPVGRPLKIPASVTSVVFSADGTRVLTASLDNVARLWDASTAQLHGFVAPYRRNSSRSAVPPVFSSDGRYLLAVSSDGSARLWNTETGKPVGANLQGLSMVRLVAISPSTRHLVSVSGNGVRVWDLTAGEALGGGLQHDSEVTSAAFSPDGRLIVTAARDGAARIWDVATGRLVGAPLRHAGVFSATFSLDGRRAITGSRDGTARMWNVLLDVPSPGEADRLADLAEVLGGYRVTDLGSVVSIEESERLTRVRRVAGRSATAFVPVTQLLRDFAGAGPTQPASVLHDSLNGISSLRK